MPFGAQVSNPQHYYYEQLLNVGFSLNVAQGSSVNVDITSLTMPWTGTVLVDGYAQVAYTPSVLGCEVWPATAIGPTNAWAGKVTEYTANGGLVVCPFFAQWVNLSAGTFFKLTIQIKCTAANGTVTAQSFVGSLRAQAA